MSHPASIPAPGTRRRCSQALLALALALLPVLTGVTSPATLVYPNDPNLRYTEYVHVTISQERARFDRFGVDNYTNVYNPSARVNFASDATQIQMRVDYYQGSCFFSGCGKFWLEVDDRVQPQAIGSDIGAGVRTYQIFSQPSARRHNFSLILPYSSAVDFLGLALSGGTPGLLTPPDRPTFRYVAYGDSITNGYFSTGVIYTYPDRVARLKGWSVINMGFSGETTVPSDGTQVGLLGGDVVTLAIGVNDYNVSKPRQTFERDYQALLDAIRTLQPTVPLYAQTPLWVSYEDSPNNVGLRVEDYRTSIRAIVAARRVTDPNLYLVEGLDLVPNSLAYFADGLHPNNAGFREYALNLAAVLP